MSECIYCNGSGIEMLNDGIELPCECGAKPHGVVLLLLAAAFIGWLLTI